MYVVDVTGRVVHKPRAEGEECEPPAGATVGYAPNLDVLVAEGFSLCSVCFGEVPEEEPVAGVEAAAETSGEEVAEGGEVSEEGGME